MDKYLVTGAMGFVGSHWCENLLKQGKIVYGLDVNPSCLKLLGYDKFVFIHDSIMNSNILKNAVDKVDCVCHFAGIAEPDLYTKYPRKVMEVVAGAGIELIEMCRLSDKLFFLTSTSEIYGKSNKVPFKEDGDRILGSTMTKRWCYSTSKAILEHYLDACAFSKELNYVIVRLFNVYGPRLKGRVVSLLINNALENNDLLVHGDGKQTRCFTYIDDVIDAFNRLTNDPKCYNQVFNVGNPVETSMNDLAKAIIKNGNFSSEIKHMDHYQYYGKSYEDIKRRVPDISKIKKYTKWEPNTSLEKGIAKTIDFMKSENA